MTDATDKTVLGFETRAIHAGAQADPTTGSRITPIYQTTAYAFRDVKYAQDLFNLQVPGHIYTRLSNPTNNILEDRVAALEGGIGALSASSGHAAQFLTFFSLLEAGDEFIASKALYGGSINQFGVSFKRFGWNVRWVEPDDPDDFRKALTPKTKAIFIEPLANPGGVILDIEAIAGIAHEAGIPLIADNTMATPYLCQPARWGADVIVHSATKFLGGHGNSMAGVIVDCGTYDWKASDKFPQLRNPDPAYHDLSFTEAFDQLSFLFKARAVGMRDMGPCLSPMNAFLILTGIETLALRMERHVANSLKVAEFLVSHPAVAWVSYAGLASSPYRALAQKYMPRGAGSVFTFGLKGGYEAGVRVVEGVKLFSHLANLGDTRSLIIHPASTTHSQLSEEQLKAAGAGPDVIRLSIGLETADDLLRDLDQALTA